MTNISRFLSGVLLAGLIATAAEAASMEPRFGNTVAVTYPDGTVLKFYYNKDNSFSATEEIAGKPVAQTSGNWRLDGINLCLKPDSDFGALTAGQERCVPLQGDKVGDSWQTKVKDASGHEGAATTKILAGR